MKFAVSNIAWPVDQDDAVAGMMKNLGFQGIEIAPTKYFPDPSQVESSDIEKLRNCWINRGLPIIAAQALLFGKPELTIFEDMDVRRRTTEYLAGVIRTCGLLGAKSLVFGSPKNRRVGDLNKEAASAIATDFFRELGRIASDYNTCVVLEANPPEYGADYLTKASEAAELVRRVDHPGVRLHLDVACMTMAGDDIQQVIKSHSDIVSHAHISEPNLAAIGTGSSRHDIFRDSLRQSQYMGWCSVEMRQTDSYTLQTLESTLKQVLRIYSTP